MKLITEIGSYKICVSVEIVAKLTNLWTKNNCKKIVNPMEGLVKEFINFTKTKLNYSQQKTFKKKNGFFF